MGTSRMGMYQILECLCHNRGWNYAVFWKLKNQNSKFLIWSEAYFDFPKPVEVKGVTGNLCFNSTNGFNALGSDVCRYPGSDIGYQLELAVANMSHLVYSLEEGVIGQIMTSRNHHWAFAESDRIGGKISKIPDEWKILFAAGIKTIVLVPVMPYGLVQLGSLTMMREDMKLVDYIRSLFSSIHIPSGTGFSFTPVGCFTELLFPVGFLKSGSSASASYNLPQETSFKPLVKASPVPQILEAEQLIKSAVFNTEPQHSSQLAVNDNLQISHNDIHGYKFVLNGSPCGYGRVTEAMEDSMRRTSDESSCTENWDFEENYLKMSAGKLYGETKVLSVIKAERASPCSILDQKFPSEQCSISHSLDFDFKQVNVGFDSHMECDTFLGDACGFLVGDYLDELSGSGLSQRIADDSFNFPDNYQSHGALEEDFHRGDPYLWKDIVASDGVFSSANPISDHFNPRDNAEALLGEIEQWLTDGNHSEILLDMIAADACLSSQTKTHPSQSSSADPSGNFCLGFDVKCEDQDNIDSLVDYAHHDSRNENVPFRLALSGCILEFSACEETQGKETQGSAPLRDQDHGSCSDQNGNPWSEQSTMVSLTGGTSSIDFSTLVDGSRSMNPASALSKGELPKMSRKRAKPGESCRPRPRDRQQIQDRIKELREIIPNGAKCSIDILFERTIKHMLFLRSISNHVDKLKNCSQPKVTKDEGLDPHHATWAVELGSQPGSCPLIVENLSHPGHMLIEMLCDDHALFLEIAHVIRGLGQTILKGIMETRADKKWAHFVIEVTRGFQRMDILWPLMRLLRAGNILE